MRPVTFLAMLASVGPGALGCSAPASAPATWQKQGADEQTVARDTTNCRTLAQAEALRQYPYSAGSTSIGAAGVVAAQQQNDSNRIIVETGRFNDCMAERGYKRG
ncbi:MAG TPA: hypothetical protein VGM96_20065 [Reyranella sp.]|jgi:hypothetical protein